MKNPINDEKKINQKSPKKVMYSVPAQRRVQTKLLKKVVIL